MNREETYLSNNTRWGLLITFALTLVTLTAYVAWLTGNPHIVVLLVIIDLWAIVFVGKYSRVELY